MSECPREDISGGSQERKGSIDRFGIRIEVREDVCDRLVVRGSSIAGAVAEGGEDPLSRPRQLW